MEKLSKNFSRVEFSCKCGCGFDTIDAGLINILQDLRDHFSARVVVLSGNRCAQHNESIGGSENSQHKKSRAADIFVVNVSPKGVHAYLDSKYGQSVSLGLYETFTHVDTRTNGGARWTA